MQRDAGEPDPADEFERIVAGWRREKSVPAWPDDLPPDGGTQGGAAGPGSPEATEPAGDARPPGRSAREDPPLPDAHPAVPAAGRDPDDGAPDADHFVPPEPPPLPPVGPPFLVGVGLLLLGVVLIAAPWWIGIPDVYGLPLGLVTLAGGLGWLVLRLWPDPPTRGGGDGHDNGAVL
ncbi:hypothetical protein [Pseudonocardia sp.]|uniref:hypothetical protein n=1 Tax=Pseudonocardia sp. TaxID=60912 RepID=UPI003D105260